MIVFDLHCAASGDTFEAWFRSNSDFERQLEHGQVHCPVCKSSRVTKAPMAPRVPRRDNSEPEAREVIARLARLQAVALRDSHWVGDEFTETARAMHLGEIDTRPVHGEATVEQALGLVEDGVPIAPLPLPVIPPNQVN
jgi:hypothetical protein